MRTPPQKGTDHLFLGLALNRCFGTVNQELGDIVSLVGTDPIVTLIRDDDRLSLFVRPIAFKHPIHEILLSRIPKLDFPQRKALTDSN